MKSTENQGKLKKRVICQIMRDWVIIIINFFGDISRYNDNDQEFSNDNMSDLKNVYNMCFCSLGNINLAYFW